ncbi:hypothetical protein BGZ72_010338 [Mortierella alpina]|nr:hypothetical protein BGZ72_010338 [Mortierella alpina]
MPAESHTSDDEKRPAAMTPSQAASAGSNWDETMEMALFYAAIKYKPVAELWEKLGGMYDLGTLDEREDSGLFVDENEDEESDEEQDISFKNSEEFVLPLHDYDHLVKEVFREPSRNPSPSPIRTTRAREGSQTPSVADSSRASSPDEDDLPRKRRASRAVKKSDVNETPSPRTSATPTSSTRRTTRAKAPEAAPVTRRKTGKKTLLMGFLLALLSYLSVVAADFEADTTNGDKVMTTPDSMGSNCPIELDSSNIMNSVAAHKPSLVMFYSPTCPYSKRELKTIRLQHTKDYVIAIYNAKPDDERRFARSNMGITNFNKYPHLVFYPRGIKHTSKSCSSLTMDTLAGHESDRTAQKLCQEFQDKARPLIEDLTNMSVQNVCEAKSKPVVVLYHSPDCPASQECLKAYTKIVEDESGGQCKVKFAKYEAWTERTFNGKPNVESAPVLKVVKPDGKSETYSGSCSNKEEITAWIKGLFSTRNALLDDIKSRFTQATTEDEKKALLGQGLQMALRASSMGEDVDDYFDFFSQALESTGDMAIEDLTEESTDHRKDVQSAFAIERGESQDIVSELEFRSTLFEQKDHADFQAEGWFDPPRPPIPATLPNLNCTAAPGTVSTLLSELSGILDPLETGTFMDLLGEFIEGSLSSLLKAVAKGANIVAVTTIKAVISALTMALTMISEVDGLKYIVKPVLDLLSHLALALNTLSGCLSPPLTKTGNAKNEVLQQKQQQSGTVAQDQCGAIADLYRILLKGAIKQCPVVPESASQELKRVLAGSSLVLDLMESTSIAKNNEALLDARPIFSAGLLDQYRREVMHLAENESEEIKAFAQTDLAMTVSISNALEACLHVAAEASEV